MGPGGGKWFSPFLCVVQEVVKGFRAGHVQCCKFWLHHLLDKANDDVTILTSIWQGLCMSARDHVTHGSWTRVANFVTNYMPCGTTSYVMLLAIITQSLKNKRAHRMGLSTPRKGESLLWPGNKDRTSPFYAELVMRSHQHISHAGLT